MAEELLRWTLPGNRSYVDARVDPATGRIELAHIVDDHPVLGHYVLGRMSFATLGEAVLHMRETGWQADRGECALARLAEA